MAEFIAHPVDVHVGVRIRERRKTLGISQTDLANALGITFQQVQKYERGHNRISASKLWETARTLKIEIDYFFDDLDNDNVFTAAPAMEQSIANFLRTAEGIELAQAFPTVGTPRRRRKVLDLVKAMAFNGDAE